MSSDGASTRRSKRQVSVPLKLTLDLGFEEDVRKVAGAARPASQQGGACEGATTIYLPTSNTTTSIIATTSSPGSRLSPRRGMRGDEGETQAAPSGRGNAIVLHPDHQGDQHAAHASGDLAHEAVLQGIVRPAAPGGPRGLDEGDNEGETQATPSSEVITAKAIESEVIVYEAIAAKTIVSAKILLYCDHNNLLTVYRICQNCIYIISQSFSHYSILSCIFIPPWHTFMQLFMSTGILLQ